MFSSTERSSVFCQESGFGGFGSSPTQTSPFGSAIQPPQPAFGSNGQQSQPAFGSSIFGSSTPFGGSSQPAFGSMSTPAFGATSIPAFGSTTSAPAFVSTRSAIGMSSAPVVGTHTPTQAFADTAIGQSTFVADSPSIQTEILESISAILFYKDKSHEELRWEDYQLGDKGGPLASPPQSTGMTAPSIFGSSTSAAAPSIFGSPQSPFGANSSSQPFGSSSSLFMNNTSSQPFVSSTTSPFGSSIFGNTQSSPLFNTSAPTNPQSGSTFGQNTSPFGQIGAFSQQPSFFNPPSSGLVGSIFSNSATVTSNAPTGFGQTTPSLSTPSQTAQPAQSSGTFSFSNFGRTQPAGGSSFGGTPGMFGQNNFGLQTIPQNSMVAQPAPIIRNPSTRMGGFNSPAFDQSSANPFSSTKPNSNRFEGRRHSVVPLAILAGTMVVVTVVISGWIFLKLLDTGADDFDRINGCNSGGQWMDFA